MNKLFLILIFVLFLVSCQREEESKTDVPDWFLPKIEELEKNNQCFGCTITRLTYNNEIYYDLYCSYWSTRYRHLYDSKGNHIEIGNMEEYYQFVANKGDEVVIWQCGD